MSPPQDSASEDEREAFRRLPRFMRLILASTPKYRHLADEVDWNRQEADANHNLYKQPKQ